MKSCMHTLIEKLINNFPELEKDINLEMENNDGWDTDMYGMYENVFVPYIVEMVSNKNENKIKKIFEYIEELVTSENEYTRNTSNVSIIECLWSYSDIREEIKKYFLPASLKSYLESEK